MIQQLLSIARNTFVESIRQPVFVVLVITGLLLLALSPSLAAYTLSDDNKLLVDLGLSTVFMLCLLLAAFTATSVLSEEVENRTVLTVVSKPVARPTFVIGKYLGVAGAIALAFYILTLAFLFASRHGVLMTVRDLRDWPVIIFGSLAVGIALLVAVTTNFLYRWVFSSTFTGTLGVTATVAALLAFSFSKQWELQLPWTDFVADGAHLGQIAVGLVLVFEAVLLLTAVAITASTRLGQIMTLLVCIGVFVIGLINNSFSAVRGQASAHPRGSERGTKPGRDLHRQRLAAPQVVLRLRKTAVPVAAQPAIPLARRRPGQRPLVHRHAHRHRQRLQRPVHPHDPLPGRHSVPAKRSRIVSSSKFQVSSFQTRGLSVGDN